MSENYRRVVRTAGVVLRQKDLVRTLGRRRAAAEILHRVELNGTEVVATEAEKGHFVAKGLLDNIGVVVVQLVSRCAWNVQPGFALTG